MIVQDPNEKRALEARLLRGWGDEVFASIAPPRPPEEPRRGIPRSPSESRKAPTHEELIHWLLQLFNSPTYDPPLLPTSVGELLEITRKADCSFPRVLHLLEHDPLVAARVLRMAQSAMFASKTPIQSLEQALLRLGLQNLSDLFLHVTLTARVFRARGYEVPMEQQRRHGVATAYAARLICKATSLPDEHAFLCGLLHDVGKIASLIVLSEHLGASKDPDVVAPSMETIAAALGPVHTKAGGIVCDIWRLPADVKLVALHHHHPFMQGRYLPMPTVVALANALALEHDKGSSRAAKAQIDILRRALDISSTAWEKIGRAYVEQVRHLGLIRR